MAYDLGVTARQRYTKPAYSGAGGIVTIENVGGEDYYYHRFITTVGTFTNTSAVPLPIELVDENNNVVQTVTVPPAGSYTVVDTSATSFTVHSFTSSGAFTPSSVLTNVSALLVAGGGGGGYGRNGNHAGGGGGAGGVRYYENLDISAGTKTITIGAGGAVWAQGIGTSITGFPVSVVNPTGGGKGGGDGGADFANAGGIGPSGGGNGGSGGGGSPGYAVVGGTGIAGEGFRGAGTPADSEGGSGGGAGGPGSINAGSVGAAGGIGRLIDIAGTSTYYGGGGGAAAPTPGPGGLGGGGDGGGSGPATAGTPNTGGGGGGANPPNLVGGAGGSGIVIIKYQTSLGTASGGTVTYVIDQAPLSVRYPAPDSNDPDPNFKNTTLLLSSPETPVTFVNDGSTNYINMSIVGNAKPNDFNPYSENYSLNFNGSSSLLRVASTSTAAFGPDDFTVEAWIYVTGTTGTYRTIYSTRPNDATAGIYTGGSFGVNPTGGLYWYTGELVVNNASDLLLTNNWNHVVVTKHEGYVNIFLNGLVVPNTDAAGVSASVINYLVVAGGGGGGSTGGDGFAGQGGGGAGGLLTDVINAGFGITYPVIVGAGAAVGAVNGSTSSFISVVATGGGRGGAFKQAGFAGGSGGGGGGRLSFAGGSGTPGQGRNGGAANTGDTAGTGSGGGGGGAGGTGANGVTGTGGRGGDGLVSTISGTSTYYAGGGGGMAVGTGGTGGLGGGGAGASASGSTDLGAGGNATRNTGGGGGGGPGNGPGLGGSGIVILSHSDSLPQAVVTGGATITTTGSNIVYTFTASGTISFVAAPISPPVNELIFTTATIGANLNGSEPFNGYISNLRVVKGQGLYTEEFVVGTQPLTTSTIGHTSINSAITGTVSLLTAASNNFTDKSSANLSMTGTAAVSNLQPFTYPYSADGSAYFGVGDYLQLSSNSANQFQTNNFTIECWVYLNSAVTAANRLIWYNYLTTFAAECIFFGGHASYAGRITFWAFNANSAAPLLTDPTALTPRVWTHLAVVRNGNNFTLYRDGVSVSTAISSANIVSNAYTFGGFIGTSGTTSLDGYISNFRIVNGTAVYTSNFALPTRSLTAVTNTALLALQTTNLANNKFFRDTSTPIGNTIITPIGTVTQGIANPYGGGWSGHFDGTGDSLSIPSAAGSFGTGNFTIEGWLYPQLLSNMVIIDTRPAATGLEGWVLHLNTDNTLQFSNDNTIIVTSSSIVPINTWSHIAVCRVDATVALYINGVVRGTGAIATDVTPSSLFNIGIRSFSTSALVAFNGYVSNLRIVKGTAVYTANFTPPASDLPRIANTALLTLQNNRFVDNSENNFTITQVGNSSIQRFSPYRTLGYKSLINSGSMYFNGSSDYLNIAYDGRHVIGTRDFTIDAWVYLLNRTGIKIILSSAPSLATGAYYFGLDNTSGVLTFNFSNASIYTGITGVELNSWNHVSVTRNNGILYFWINGQLEGSVAFSNTIDVAGGLRVGAGRSISNFFSGYMSDLRLVVGTALYVGLSYEPLTAIGNTVLLTAQSSTLVDNSTYQNFITGFAPRSSSNPFGISPGTNGYYSYSFNDSANQVLSISNTPVLNFGSDDFTIEAWIYPTSVAGENVIVSLFGYSNNRRSWSLEVTNENILFRTASEGTSSTDLYSNTVLSINTWYFVSAIKQGTTAKIYINGRLDVSGTVPYTLYNNTVDPVYIGAKGPRLSGYFAGLISNLRILKGIARIPETNATINFPVSQSSAKAVPDTVLLLNGTAGTIVDQTGRNDLVTVGEVKLHRTSQYENQSVSFPGSGSYLSIPYNALHNLSNGNFTIEAWVYPTTSGVARGIINNWQIGGQFIYQITASGTLIFQYTNAASGISTLTYTGTTTVPANAWTHIAVVRNGTSLTHYINGVIDAGGSYNIGTQTLFYYNGEAKDLRIGVGGDAGSPFTGILSDVRMVKGTAVYTANFTPPTTRLTAITNTLILACQGNAFRDLSNNNFAVNLVGTPSLTPNTQFGVPPIVLTTPYGNGKFVNSMYFDGSGDYISIPLTPVLQFGTRDFTIEFWSYFIGRGVNGSGLVNNYTTFQAGSLGVFAGHSSANITKYQVSYNGTGFPNIQSTTSILYNQWAHIAVVRFGTTITLYINGIAEGTIANATAALNGTGSWTVGTAGDSIASYYTNGYIDNLRITNGIARYTSTFTVPRAPFPIR